MAIMKTAQLQAWMKKKGINGCIFFNRDPNFFYFSQQKSGSLFLIPAKGDSFLFISRLERVKGNFKTLMYENLFSDLKKLLKFLKIHKLGVNEYELTVKQKKQIDKLTRSVDVSKRIYTLRLSKTDSEIALIRKACALTQKVLKEIIQDFHFKKESEIKGYITRRAQELDCELSFNPIVASGRNAAIPHHESNSFLKRGFLVIDMGLKYKGYCADITRTIFLGKPSKDELLKYNSLLKIQKEVIKKVKPDVKINELELFVRKELGASGKLFVHSLGHGVGIQVHELPAVNKKSEQKLIPGMVITIEPGVYDTFGIRIEDNLLVTRNGCKSLSTFSKKLIIIPKV